MRTVTILSLVAILGLGTASRAMCSVRSGDDLRQSGWASLTEVWHPLSQVGTGTLPGHQNQVLADKEWPAPTATPKCTPTPTPKPIPTPTPKPLPTPTRVPHKPPCSGSQ